ncbi:MAG: STAS domain-containing protein [Sutterella wadsworthensis]|nr:STAS domain-containing protein [Sutterella wadsworthensis]
MKFNTPHLTFVEASKAKALVVKATRNGDYTLDFEGVVRVDSTVLALALYAYRQAKAAGKELTLLAIPPGFMELVKLYGLETLLKPH